MKEEKVNVMDEKDEKLCDVLQVFGQSSVSSRVLVYLLNEKTGQSKDIEQAMNLRQPQVSIGVRELRSQGIAAKKDMPCHGKGRPSHKYRLKMSVEAIRKMIEGEKDRRIKEIQDDWKKLESLLTRTN